MNEKRLFRKRKKESETIPIDLKNNGSTKVNSLVVAQRLTDVISMILDGKAFKDISELMIAKYAIKPHLIRQIVIDANKEIASRKQYELDDLLNEHVERYEYIYSKLTELKASTYAMNALQAKEKLIQLHKGGTHMRVIGGSVSTIAMISDRVSYDPTRLNEQQSKRLTELITKISNKQDDQVQ